MGINLLDKYPNNYKPEAKKPSVPFDMQTSSLRPLNAKGTLVNSSVKEFAKDIKYSSKALTDGFSGHAGDHQLGKTNDIGLKLGGLAIAGYLLTKRQTPMTKIMELVGFGAFFASMALWPKIALELPAKVIHGFNINQKYRNLSGDKKKFFQDPHYLPWDLYSQKQLDEIGDKLKIDKNAHDRNELIQEKMKKIALQNNTMWMLTAGIATPVMSALICNQAEKLALPLQNIYNEKQADKLINNIDKYAQKYKFNSKPLENFLATNKEKDLTEKLLTQIAEKINLDPVSQKSLVQDLKLELTSPEAIIKDKSINILYKNLTKDTELTQKDFVHFFRNRNQFNSPIKQADENILKVQFQNFIADTLKSKNADDETIEYIREKSAKAIKEALSIEKASKLDDNAITKIKNISDVINKNSAKINVLDKYMFKRVANSANTTLANTWNSITETLPKLLEISPKEMESVKLDRLLTQKLLNEKLEKIASDPIKYENTINKLIKKIKTVDETFSKENLEKIIGKNGKIETVFKQASEDYNNLGLKNLSAHMVGKSNGSKGSLMIANTSFYQDRILGVKYSFYRLIQTLDVFKRANQNKNEITDFAKKASLTAHSSDYAVKFDLLDKNFFKQSMEFLFGSQDDLEWIFNEGKGGLKDYKKGLSKETSTALEKHGLLNSFNEYRKDFLGKVVSADYFAKKFHKFREIPATSNEKFLLTGLAPDEMFTKILTQSANTKKWFKMFGGLGLATLGVTVLSQFFFGKNNEKEVKNV